MRTLPLVEDCLGGLCCATQAPLNGHHALLLGSKEFVLLGSMPAKLPQPLPLLVGGTEIAALEESAHQRRGRDERVRHHLAKETLNVILNKADIGAAHDARGRKSRNDRGGEVILEETAQHNNTREIALARNSAASER